MDGTGGGLHPLHYALRVGARSGFEWRRLRQWFNCRKSGAANQRGLGYQFLKVAVDALRARGQGRGDGVRGAVAEPDGPCSAVVVDLVRNFDACLLYTSDAADE